MRAAVLQLSSQGLSSTKLYNYIRMAHKNGVKVLLLGEYILNPFFKELQEMSVGMIKEQAEHQSKILKELCATYDLTIVAPIILVKGSKVYKATAKFAPKSTAYYQQQLLINYQHWNEEKFFSNQTTTLKSPLIFKQDGIKFAVINGFELHFDEIFSFIASKNVDAVLVPSVSTFDSYERWKNLILMRAFTHNCYILRANRIGEYKDKELTWNFYGDSVLASPNGELTAHLGNKEELMIVDLEHSEVLAAKKFWGFHDKNKKLNPSFD